MKRRIFFPGSFNPFTAGHADILRRLLALADFVTVGIGMNIDKPGSSELADTNARAILDFIADSGLTARVDVIVYSGLTGQKAKDLGASCIARGVRSATDFDYEYSMAAVNRSAFGIETIFLPADPQLGMVSSTVVRDLLSHGRDDIAKRFMP